jgi:hypothetical protein
MFLISIREGGNSIGIGIMVRSEAISKVIERQNKFVRNETWQQ